MKNIKGVVGETTWRHMFTLKPEDRAKLFETKPEDGQQKLNRLQRILQEPGGETSRAGGNPSYTDIVNYIKQICADIGLTTGGYWFCHCLDRKRYDSI